MARDLEQHFATYYEIEAGNGVLQKARTKEQNDNFAASLEFMNAKVIKKSQWDAETRRWEIYL